MTAILVISFLVLLITASYIVQRYREGKQSSIIGVARDRGLNLPDFRIPKGVFFHPGHTWVKLQTGGNVRVGIDDFVTKLAGPLNEIDLPEIGSELSQGAPVIGMKFDSKILSLPAPVSGVITRINKALLERPSDIGRHSFEREWLIDVQPSKLSDELRGLSIAEQVRQWIGKEIERIKEFLISQSGRPELVGGTLPDGGEPVEGVLNMLDAEGIQQFEKSFLKIQ